MTKTYGWREVFRKLETELDAGAPEGLGIAVREIGSTTFCVPTAWSWEITSPSRMGRKEAEGRNLQHIIKFTVNCAGLVGSIGLWTVFERDIRAVVNEMKRERPEKRKLKPLDRDCIHYSICAQPTNGIVYQQCIKCEGEKETKADPLDGLLDFEMRGQEVPMMSSL